MIIILFSIIKESRYSLSLLLKRLARNKSYGTHKNKQADTFTTTVLPVHPQYQPHHQALFFFDPETMSSMRRIMQALSMAVFIVCTLTL